MFDCGKYIDDTYGHNVGDMILQKLTHVSQKTIRQSDVFVRVGGEKFALFLPNTPLREAIKSVEIKSLHLAIIGDGYKKEPAHYAFA